MNTKMLHSKRDKNQSIKWIQALVAVLLVISLLGIQPAQPVQAQMICESFDSFYPLENKIGTYTGWFSDSTNGPVVSAGDGVAGSVGLLSGSSIYNWTAYPFNWNASDFQKIILQQDFKTASDGRFDDDRLSWTINGSSTNSNDQFGVQLDHPNGGIVTYWSNTYGGTRINDVIVPLTAGTDTRGDTWYRFRAEIIKLTSTSAKIDVYLTELDSSGNPTGIPITGSVPDTNAWTSGRTPAAAYFTPNSMMPSYKNHTTSPAPADNTCHEIVLNTDPTITISGTLTEFSAFPGVASLPQTYTVSGVNLTEGILITAPSGFELSTDGLTYTNSLTLPEAGGSVSNTMIYVRLYSEENGTFSGDITHVSSGATTRNVPVSGTVSNEVTITFQEGASSYTGTLDTTIKYNTPTTSYGSQVYFEWDTQESTGTTPEIALLQFSDIFGANASQIPFGSTITSATLQYRTYSGTNSWGSTAGVYESLVSWDEANTYNTFGGDAGVQTDEYNSTLVATASGAAVSTNYTIDVTASLQRWSDGADNYGWIFLSNGTDGVEVHSSEATTVTYRPLLTVEYFYSTDPTIITSGTLTEFNAEPGEPSDPQTYTVRGANLEADISIVAPSGYQLSTDGLTYTSSINLPQTGGSVPVTTIYVHLLSSTEGTYAGNITHSSSGAAPVEIPVTGEVAIAPEVVTFQQGVAGYAGTQDTYILETSPTTSYGDAITIEWDTEDTGGNANSRKYALLRFDNIFGVEVGKIPVGSTIQSAYLEYYVSNTSPTAAQLHGVLVDWSEATSYNTFGYTAGVQAEDYGSQVTTAPATLINIYYSIDVTSSLAAWVNDPGSNRGWIFIPTNVDGADVSSSENATAAQRPRLIVNYFPSTNPTIITSGTLTEFTTAPGVASASQTYTVSGVNLEGNIAISAPAGFQLSLDDTNYDTTLTLTPSGGVIDSTTVYVRLYSATQGIFSGNILHTSANATDRLVAVSGKVETITCSDITLTATEDNWLRGSQATTNYGGATVLQINPNGTNSQIALLKWDLSSIPSNALINSTSLTFYVTDASPKLFYLYDLKRSWVEGTGTTDNTPSNDSSNWNTYDGVNTWGAGGAQGTSDRNSTNLWTAAAGTFNQLNDVSVELNNSGVSVVQGWVDTPSNNSGLTIQNSATDSDYLYIASSEATNVAQRPRLNINYCSSSNNPPNSPIDVQPQDDATGVAIPAPLLVTVSDPNLGDQLDVSFYGRPVATTTPAEDFTIIVLPDTQFYAESYPGIFTSQTTWISNQKVTRNIVFTAHVGDVVNVNNETQYTYADTSMDVLDTGGVNYALIPGNHDGDLFDTYFGAARYAGKTYYQGHYGSNNYNNYSFITAGGMDFIIIGLQYNPATSVLDWADALLKANPDRRGIVFTHNLLNTDSSWSNTDIYPALSDNPNLFLMLCGHNHGEAQRTDTSAYGTIYSLLADFQSDTNGGNGYLRIMTFSPTTDTINVQTYSPYTGLYYTDANSQFSLTYDMPGIMQEDFQLIGTANDVANGSTASVAWSGLAYDTEYEWYATVSDGLVTTTGPIWSFRTIFPTAVSISSFTGLLHGDAIRLSWESANELDLIGFNLYRSNGLEGERSILNQAPIMALSPGGLDGNRYEFIDAQIEPGLIYTYWLEVMTHSGSHLLGPAEAGGYVLFIPMINK